MSVIGTLLLGFAYVAPPGPVNVETLRRGTTGGFGAALGLQLGAVAGDLVYALLALLGVGSVVPHRVLGIGLGPISAAILLYLGISALRDGIHHHRRPFARQRQTLPCNAAEHALLPCDPAQHTRVRAPRHDLLAGLLISLANPFALVFWLALGGTGLAQTQGTAVSVLSVFFAALLLWAVALPLCTLIGRGMVRGHAGKWLSLGCGVTLIGFGMSTGLGSILPLIVNRTSFF